MQEWIERQEIGLYSHNGYIRGAYACFWHFFAVLAQTLSNCTQIYVHFTPDLRILMEPYADHYQKYLIRFNQAELAYVQQVSTVYI